MLYVVNICHYQLGVEDSVRCFQCGEGLRDWDQGGRPFETHAYWYPECKYVQQVKDQENKDIDSPQYPAFSGASERASSFEAWQGDKVDFIEKAVDAGFFLHW